MKLKSFVFCLLIGLTASADTDSFKNCQNSNFCQRCRNAGKSIYNVVLDSVNISEPTEVSFDIRDIGFGRLFVVKIRAVQDEIFRVEIDEKSPLKLRYRVTEALVDAPIIYKALSAVKINETSITIESGNNTAVVKVNPFSIDFLHGDILAAQVNAQQLLRFEHLRTKPEIIDPRDEGSWEEEFRGVIDSKPNGPEAVAVDFTFPESEVLFGIPEHADNFALRKTVGSEPYRLYNLDVYFYDENSRMALHGSAPVIYGHGAKQTAGIFWHNSADTFIDVHDDKTSHFMSEAGIIDFFVLLGPKPADVFTQYTRLTGVGNLPQLYSLGYHQSRWQYRSQEEVLQVVENFDKNNLQLDAIWLDIDYTDDKRYFTWNLNEFPNPIEMINTLNSTGRHLTIVIDPHVKIDDGYHVHSNASARGFYVKKADGVSDFEGNCWPGWSSILDFFNPEAREYYADQYLLENFRDQTVDVGIWNDMNEPGVFDLPETTLPRDTVHFDGWEHRLLHNLYGLMHVKGTYEGVKRRDDDKLRPFVTTRAFFSGTQRYSAVYTGDISASWEHLHSSIKMCLSISAAGMSFCGSGIGGFLGDPEPELMGRWFQAAAYQPFMRGHAAENTRRLEPFHFQQTQLTAAKDALRQRYALLPLWYTMFYEHERDGLPVMRPMLSEYPLDKSGFKLDTQYMLGDKLLVAPVLNPATFVDKAYVYFPSTDVENKMGDRWYNFHTHEEIGEGGFSGTKTFDIDYLSIPVFQRGGTIIPKKEIVRKSTVHMEDDPISLFIAVDDEDSAEGTLYIDDGKSFDYQDKKYLYLKFEFKNNVLSSKKIDDFASYATGSRIRVVVIAGLKEDMKFAKAKVGEAETYASITKASTNVHRIDGLDLVLTEEWTLTVSSASRNIFCFALLAALAFTLKLF